VNASHAMKCVNQSRSSNNFCTRRMKN